MLLLLLTLLCYTPVFIMGNDIGYPGSLLRRSLPLKPNMAFTRRGHEELIPENRVEIGQAVPEI
jgi:hypothetical protein